MNIFLDGCKNHIAIQRMLPHWRGRDVLWYEDPSKCDVQLSLIRIKTETALPTVLRLDGIYYDLNTNYIKRNLKICTSHSKADAVIYQSEYCKGMCEKYLSARKEDANSFVIYNGINKEWCGRHNLHSGINIIVVAHWRRHKRLKEIIDVFKEVWRDNKEIRLLVIGDLADNKEVTHPGIKYYHHINYDTTLFANLFTISDLSIHLSMKDCSPNSVVEAIGAGIPVITTSACGGATEMCNMVKGCYAVYERERSDPCPHYTNVYNMLEYETKKELIALLNELVRKKQRVKQPKELSAEYMADKYLRVFRGVRDK